MGGEGKGTVEFGVVVLLYQMSFRFGVVESVVGSVVESVGGGGCRWCRFGLQDVEVTITDERSMRYIYISMSI